MVYLASIAAAKRTAMKPYKSLIRQGKARRLRKLAINAFEFYGLDAIDVQLAGIHTNALFRVRTAGRFQITE